MKTKILHGLTQYCHLVEDNSSDTPDQTPASGNASFVDKVKVGFNNFVTRTKRFLSTTWTKIKEGLSRTWTNIKAWSSRTWASIKRGTRKTIKFLDHINSIQVLIALLIAGIGVYFSYGVFENAPNVRIWMYVMVVTGIILGSVAWVYLGKRYFGKILYYVIEQKYTRKVIAGGAFSYYEYKDPNDKTVLSRFTEPIGIIITSLIAMLGIAVTVIGLIRIVNSNLAIDSPILWGILAIVSPILATPIIPISWMMDDAQIKSWNPKNNTTWTVSSKYKARLNSFISVGAVISNLRSGINVNGVVDQLPVLGGILKIGALVIFITIGGLIIFYFVFFKNYLRQLTINALDIELYTLELKEVEGNQFGLEKQEPEPEEEKDDEADETEKSEVTVVSEGPEETGKSEPATLQEGEGTSELGTEETTVEQPTDASEEIGSDQAMGSEEGKTQQADTTESSEPMEKADSENE